MRIGRRRMSAVANERTTQLLTQPKRWKSAFKSFCPCYVMRGLGHTSLVAFFFLSQPGLHFSFLQRVLQRQGAHVKGQPQDLPAGHAMLMERACHLQNLVIRAGEGAAVSDLGQILPKVAATGADLRTTLAPREAQNASGVLHPPAAQWTCQCPLRDRCPLQDASKPVRRSSAPPISPLVQCQGGLSCCVRGFVCRAVGVFHWGKVACPLDLHEAHLLCLVQWVKDEGL